MVPEIHTIADHIFVRRQDKWKDVQITVDFEKTEFIYESMVNTMNTWLQQLSSNLIDKEVIHNNIHNLLSVKKRLSQPPWYMPTNLNREEEQCFLFDFHFYLMLSALLIKASDLFCGYIDPAQCISPVQFFPDLKITYKRFKQLLNILPPSLWLGTILYQQENNRYLLAIKNLHNHLEQFPNNQFLSFLKEKIKNHQAETPTYLIEEKYITYQIDLACHLLNSQFSTDNWPQMRMLYQRCVMAGLTFPQTTDKYISLYRKRKSLNKAKINQEIKSWKIQLKNLSKALNAEIPFYTLVNHQVTLTITTLEILKEAIEQESKVPQQLLTWHDDPKNYIKLIHSTITSGQIQLKGVCDAKPILQYLSQFIRVRKLNNDGTLTYSSLLTYYKKANTGDL